MDSWERLDKHCRSNEKGDYKHREGEIAVVDCCVIRVE